MTKDEVLKAVVSVCDPNTVSPIEKDGLFVVVTQDELLAFANAIADLQREKDAKICDSMRTNHPKTKGPDGARAVCAAAIRANKEST